MTTLPVVQDCPACVWDQFGAPGMDPEFVKEYRVRIDQAARELIRSPLIEAWRQHGYRAVLLDVAGCEADSTSPDDPPASVYDEVRQQAADAIDPDRLVRRADLLDEFVAWRRAHPYES